MLIYILFEAQDANRIGEDPTEKVIGVASDRLVAVNWVNDTTKRRMRRFAAFSLDVIPQQEKRTA